MGILKEAIEKSLNGTIEKSNSGKRSKKDIINDLKEEAGISSPRQEDTEVIEALSNSKVPIQRLGQGLHGNIFYYGTSLNWRSKPISAVITSDKKCYLGLKYIYWNCEDCKYTEEQIIPAYEKPKAPKSCNCKQGNNFKISSIINPIINEFGLNYRIDFNEDAIDYIWNTESIKSYLEGNYTKKTIQELFKSVLNINKKYIEHLNPLSHDYTACWIIGSYCYTLFEQFGRLYNRAEKGSGKTKQAKILRNLCFNPMWITKGTESSQFRDAEATCGTFIVDNMDKLHEDLKRAMEHLIETGWMKEATYRLTDKDTGRTMKYRAYSSMAINNIYGLDENTIDKTFEIPMLKSINNNIKRNKPTSKSEDWEELRDSIRYYVLDNWKEIQRVYSEINATFSGREFDVVEGALTIAKLVGEDTYKQVEAYVKEKIEEEQVDLENNNSYKIFSLIWATFEKNPLLQEDKIFYGELADILFRDFNPTLEFGTADYDNKKKGFAKYLGKIIKSVPMFRKTGMSNGRTYVIIKRKDLEQYMELQHFFKKEDTHLHTSTTSTTSTKSLSSTNNNIINQKGVDVVDQVDEVEEKTAVDEPDYQNIEVIKI